MVTVQVCLEEMAARPWHQEWQSMENAGGDVQKDSAEAGRWAGRWKEKSRRVPDSVWK